MLDYTAGRLALVVGVILYVAALIVGATLVGWSSGWSALIIVGGTFGVGIIGFVLVPWTWGLITWITDNDPDFLWLSDF